MSPITTHILDIALGRPGRGIAVVLEKREDGHRWTELARGISDDNGRINLFEPPLTGLQPGVYRVHFATADYFAKIGVPTFYPEIQVIVLIDHPDQHYHVPLLLSPYGYSTYRGS
jgi:5-hydroxyisourate hydrolase